jgi:hypothetical protein
MIKLDTEHSLPLTARRASRIVCHSGRLWVTRKGDRTDWFLAAGDGLEVHGGLTVVTALEPSTLTLEPPIRSRHASVWASLFDASSRGLRDKPA